MTAEEFQRELVRLIYRATKSKIDPMTLIAIVEYNSFSLKLSLAETMVRVTALQPKEN
jgi:hypothetical protein